MYPIISTDSERDRFFSIAHHKNKLIADEMKGLIEVVSNYKHVDILKGVKAGKLI